MAVEVEVELAVLGRSALDQRRYTVALPLGRETTLGGLIGAVVEQELTAHARTARDAHLVRVLTATALHEGIVTGAIRSGGRDDQPDPADIVGPVATALLAHRDGLFQVWVDGREVTDLADPVTVRSGMRLLFLRLVALAGG
jgi:hypothetical protein